MESALLITKNRTKKPDLERSTEGEQAVTETRDFHIGDILSVTTGRLVSPRHISGVYDILGWMVSEDLMTHQLPRVSDECAPDLRRQHPDLAAVVVPEDVRDEASVMSWLSAQVSAFGETRPVAKLAPEDHTPIGPITELRLKRPDMPIIGFGL